MIWRLIHENVSVVPETSEIVSKSSLIFEHDGFEVVLAQTDDTENHILGSKKVLVDTANALKKIAREMENKADRLY